MKLNNKVINNGFVSFFSLSILLILLTIGSNRFDQIDYGIYLEFSKSILDDGDLNVSNQLIPLRLVRDEPIILTPNNYDPSYHPYSGSSFYVPILSLSRYLSPLFHHFVPEKEKVLKGGVSKTSVEIFSESLLCAFNVALVYFSFFLIFKFCTKNISVLRYVLLSHSFFFMTPLFNYTFFQPGNMNILSFFLGTVSFILITKRKEFDVSTLTISLFLFTGLMIKYEVGLFLLLFIIMKIIDYRKSLKGLLKEFQIIFISSLPACIYFLINNHHQFGSLFLKYGGMTFESFLSYELLLSPLHGYLFVSPFIALVFIAIFYLRKTIPIEISIFFSLVIFKFLGESLTISSGVDFGSRNYLSDMSVLFIAFLFLEKKMRSGWFYSLVTCSVLWTLSWNALYYVFLPGQTLGSYFLSLDSAFLLIVDKIELLDPSLGFSVLKLIFISLFCAVFLKIVLLKKHIFKFFLGYFYLFSIVVTLMNINSNSSVPSNTYSKGKGMELWFYIENMGGYRERIARLNNYEDSESAQIVNSSAIQYKLLAQKQILEGQKEL